MQQCCYFASPHCEQTDGKQQSIECVINYRSALVKALMHFKPRSAYGAFYSVCAFIYLCVIHRYLNLDLHAAVRELLNHTLNPYERLHLSEIQRSARDSESGHKVRNAPSAQSSASLHTS